MGKAYTGVDIGNETVKFAVCDGETVKTVVREPLPEGLMAEGRPVSFDALADFLKALAKQAGGIAKDIALIMPVSESLVRRIDVPAMTEKELLLNLPYEFRDYISQGKEHYSYDYAVLRTVLGADGKPESLDLLAVAALKQTVSDYAEMFRRAGMRLRSALPTQAALQNIIGGNPKALANCCIIDFAHEGTRLHFFTDGAYDVTRVIDVGGVDIDRAIASARGVDEHVANGYKLANYEQVLDDEAVRSVYDSIAVEMSRAFNFYGFNNPNATIEVAYCCGGGVMVQQLLDVVSSNVDIELRSVADVLPPAAGPDDLRVVCPSAIGATLGVR